MEMIKPAPGQLKILAYCSRCGKLLMESAPLTKAQLLKRWDAGVIGALHIKCEDCGTKFPNFEIDLKIYNTKLKTEKTPFEYIKLPKKHQSPEELFKSVAARWLKEHPDVTPPTPEEVRDQMNKIQPELSAEERLKLTLEKRQQYYGEKSTDAESNNGTV